jgi:hypothetical protein
MFFYGRKNITAEARGFVRKETCRQPAQGLREGGGSVNAETIGSSRWRIIILPVQRSSGAHESVPNLFSMATTMSFNFQLLEIRYL